jgi:hypothetical protein
VKKKLPNYVTSIQPNVTQWDKSKIFAMSNGSIQTGTIPVTIANKSLFDMWQSLYKEYQALEMEEGRLIDRELGGELDEAEERYSDDNDQESLKALNKFDQDLANIQSKIKSVDTRWETLRNQIMNMPAPIPSLVPKTQYPTYPNPLSPIFLTQTTKPGVWLVSEQFYADFRKVLDDNPNAHLQLMKYYLLENPARFRRMTRAQDNFAAADKAFRISLLCADISSVEGLILSIAASSAPPLPYLPVRACQFSAKRIAISDNSPLGGTGTPSAGTNYTF